MRMSQDEKDRSHQRIIASAAKLFRRSGIEGASVGDVMQDAGMTHGGFYKHFDSKDALLVAALDRAFDETFEKLGPELPHAEAAVVSSAFQAYYLSDGHVASPAIGCPIAALGNDVARGADLLKARFGAGVRRIVSRLARGVAGSQRTRQTRAMRQIAMMAGAVMIARASDPATAREMLAACRNGSGIP